MIGIIITIAFVVIGFIASYLAGLLLAKEAALRSYDRCSAAGKDHWFVAGICLKCGRVQHAISESYSNINHLLLTIEQLKNKVKEVESERDSESLWAKKYHDGLYERKDLLEAQTEELRKWELHEKNWERWYEVVQPIIESVRDIIKFGSDKTWNRQEILRLEELIKEFDDLRHLAPGYLEDNYNKNIDRISSQHFKWVGDMGWLTDMRPLEYIGLLASEVGECSNECRGAGNPTQELGQELADVILRAVVIMQVYGFVPSTELMSKISKNKTNGTRGRLK